MPTHTIHRLRVLTGGLAVVALAATLGLSATAAAGAPEGRDFSVASPRGRALVNFQTENPQTRLFWSGPRITRVYGSPFGGGATPEQAAEDFRVAHARFLGVSPDSLRPHAATRNVPYRQPLVFQPETGDFKFHLMSYTQYAGELPVFRGELRVLARNVAGHPLVWAAPNLREVGDFEAPALEVDRMFDPQVARAATGMAWFSQARMVVWAGLGEETVQPVVAIEYVGERGSYEDGDYQKMRFVADAATGEVLHSESLVHFEDVSGQVAALSTEGDGADFCEAEVLMAMPYADVTAETAGGGFLSNGLTDVDGNFTLDDGGNANAVVESPKAGTYFFVDDVRGAEEVVTEALDPGVQVVHNAANSSEFVRAQANAYVHSNIVRDFTVAQNPAYPTIGFQTDFDVYVNRSDGFCPGNAWYDGSSINFCRTGGGAPNTAWSSIVYHEYGHHMVEVGGSGQDQYGEGMGDVVSVLILDSSRIGNGFFGTCGSSLRTADNNYQYPCNGGGHECGQLISGAVWDTREELAVTEPVDGLAILSNLVVNSIPMHTGSTITPQITIDLLTLDDDDADLGNGSPHWAEIDAGFSAHNMAAPPLSLLSFDFPDGRPDSLVPELSTTVRVEVSGVAADPASGTGLLYTSIDGGAWTSTPMSEVSANVYDATLPALPCGSSLAWYVSAEADTGAEVLYPSDAPTSAFSALSADSFSLVLDDDFETDLGWTVTNVALDAGAWERAVPRGDGNRGDPLLDYDGSGRAYLTWNLAGDSDVDGGPTSLTSPVFDLAGGDATISYATWFYNDDGDDSLILDVSNNGGGSWVRVQTQTGGNGGWQPNSFTVSDYVTPTDDMQLRFQVADNPNDSITEAAVDAVRVSFASCDPVDPDMSIVVVSDQTTVPLGGGFSYSVTVTNNLDVAQPLEVWTALYTLDGTPVLDPGRGPKAITLGANEVKLKDLTDVAQGVAPGDYRLWVRGGEYGVDVYAEGFVDLEVTP